MTVDPVGPIHDRDAEPAAERCLLEAIHHVGPALRCVRGRRPPPPLSTPPMKRSATARGSMLFFSTSVICPIFSARLMRGSRSSTRSSGASVGSRYRAAPASLARGDGSMFAPQAVRASKLPRLSLKRRGERLRVRSDLADGALTLAWPPRPDGALRRPLLPDSCCQVRAGPWMRSSGSSAPINRTGVRKGSRSC